MQRAAAVVVAADPANKEECKSYSGLAKATIGPVGGGFVQATVLVCCFGICSAYMVFVAATMSTILAPPLLQTAMSQVIRLEGLLLLIASLTLPYLTSPPSSRFILVLVLPSSSQPSTSSPS
jgi:amino acid permease